VKESLELNMTPKFQADMAENSVTLSGSDTIG
jgi:hypothetical protein